MEGKSERKSNAKVSALREIEVDIQKMWKDEKIFEEDAPEVINSFSMHYYYCTNTYRLLYIK